MIKGKRGNKKRQRFAKTARCHEVKRAQTGKRRKKGEDEKREARAKKNEGKGKRKERRVVNCWPQFTCRIREIIIFTFLLRIFSISIPFNQRNEITVSFQFYLRYNTIVVSYI